jgi:hypothetical protein
MSNTAIIVLVAGISFLFFVAAIGVAVLVYNYRGNTTTKNNDANSANSDKENASPTTPESENGGGGSLDGKELLWNSNLTLYSSQDNTPCNSDISSRGKEHKLTPFVSVALSLAAIDKDGTGKDPKKVKYGERLYVPQLDGKLVKDNVYHNGIVVVADKCGDGSSAHCHVDGNPSKPTKLDFFIGDITDTHSIKCEYGSGSFKGAGGSGNIPIQVYRAKPGTTLPAPKDYNVRSMSPGAVCNDCFTACNQQTNNHPGCKDYAKYTGGNDPSKELSSHCWHYWPQQRNGPVQWCESWGYKAKTV